MTYSWLVENFTKDGKSTGLYMACQVNMTVTADVNAARKFRRQITAEFRALDMRDQCAAAGVPYLFKQWGEWSEVDGDKPTRTVQVESDIGETLASRCDGFISLAGEFVRSMDDATTDDPYRGMARIGKKAAGRQLDGRTHDEWPEVRHA